MKFSRRIEEIPPYLREKQPKGESTNRPELRLRDLLLERGFPAFDAQKTIQINAGHIPHTSPDLYYEDPVKGIKVAVYLDGLSKDIHGNKRTARTDYLIRTILKKMGYKVIPIPVSGLDDPEILNYFMQEI